MAIAYVEQKLTYGTQQGNRAEEHLQDESASLLQLRQISPIPSTGESGSIVSSTENLTEPIIPAMSLAHSTIGGRTCSVYVVAHRCHDQLVELRSTGDSGIEQYFVGEEFPSVPKWVLETGQPLIINTSLALPWPLNSTHCPYDRLLCVPLSTREQTLGAMMLVRASADPPFEAHELPILQSIGAMAAIALENIRLHDTIAEGYTGTIKALAGAIDAKDRYTCGHSHRVASHTLMAGRVLGLGGETLNTLGRAAMLHDIGKIGIDDSILRKPDRLTPQERACIQDHPVIGAAIASGIPFLRDTAELILYHHERYDGNGYPHGLSGSEIPLGARLICVADAFDTMTTDRPYRRAMSINEAMVEMKECNGTQFCPAALDAFVAGLSHSGHSNVR